MAGSDPRGPYSPIPCSKQAHPQLDHPPPRDWPGSALLGAAAGPRPARHSPIRAGTLKGAAWSPGGRGRPVYTTAALLRAGGGVCPGRAGGGAPRAGPLLTPRRRLQHGPQRLPVRQRQQVELREPRHAARPATPRMRPGAPRHAGICSFWSLGRGAGTCALPGLALRPGGLGRPLDVLTSRVGAHPCSVLGPGSWAELRARGRCSDHGLSARPCHELGRERF